MTLRRLVLRIARTNEERFKDAAGKVDKRALADYVLDHLDPDMLPVLEREGSRFFVWEAIRGSYRATRTGMKGGAKKINHLQPCLPSFEAVKGVKLTIPAAGGEYGTKDAPDCALWELEAVEEDYGKGIDDLIWHRAFVAALIKEMRRRGFGPGDTVRKLYGAA